MSRSFITRREYDEWILSAASLAKALRYPVDDDMINDSAGIVFGDDQYDAFENGLWTPDPYEVMIIFESLNEPAVDGAPLGAAEYSEYSGLCDKLMILHPGKFCASHYHLRKTESYEVVSGSMEVFYCPDVVNPMGEELLEFERMPVGEAWPANVELPVGRAESYEKLTSYVRLEAGDPKFVMHRKHLHAFRCPPDSKVPLVVREVSTYSHEPTEAAQGKIAPLPGWQGLHDNTFLAPQANTGRLKTNII
ncbi:hypothetical protein G7Y41_07790 [Schaalia sp. ZJ405]|uniref:hypothetical protein n=1 Tax=Schaalia sp. ZJ405 TaxID=2709403 RepID=UPI0013E9C80F|nr:hypothetical protein [Schaalia sp. ZJ405]QPK80942.1 hypothetical protein G7Y41_07790 [Schaalia sp. ZJ405]